MSTWQKVTYKTFVQKRFSNKIEIQYHITLRPNYALNYFLRQIEAKLLQIMQTCETTIFWFTRGVVYLVVFYLVL
jgi:hypothetical protein